MSITKSMINLLVDSMSRSESAGNSRKFFRDNAGAVVIGGAVMLSVFGGMSGLAIDGGHFYMANHRAEIAAEAAAQAALSSLQDRDQAVAAAIAQAQEHMPVAEYGTVLNASDVVIGRWDAVEERFDAGLEPANAVRVTVRMEEDNGNAVPLQFASMIGDIDASIVTSSVAIAQ
ncbi:MAG: TadG family pilus assembly protein [Dongiaceae bacterium]